MQWGQIKTIFIICFLVLDVYLVSQVIIKANEPPVIKNPGVASLEEELKERGIDPDSIPESTANATYISATWHTFTGEEIESLEEQKILNNGDMLYAEFETPILIGEDGKVEDIMPLLSENILFSEEYRYYSWNKEENVIIFFQQYEDQPLYYNNGGMMMFFLNDKLEITSYAQTMQNNIREEAEEKELSAPVEIVEVLLDNNRIFAGDTISNVELGYHTFFQVRNSIQAFVPTWKISVNDEKVFFVNADDGQIIDIDEDSFITDIKSLVNRLKTKLGSEES